MVNLDVLDRRDAVHYGGLTLADLRATHLCVVEGVRCAPPDAGRQTTRASSSTGASKKLDWADGVIINPGAWSHYSYAIRDAVELLKVPVVEVHLSKIEGREEWRRVSVIGDLATKRVSGEGPEGYRTAIAVPGGSRVEPGSRSSPRSSTSRCS